MEWRERELWELGEHRIYLGDTTRDEDVDALMGGEQAAMVLTDPPYAIYGSSTGIGRDIADDRMVRPFFLRVWEQVKRVLPDFGHAYVHTDWRSWAALYDAARRAGIVVKNCLVWDKVSGGLGSMYMQRHEFVAFAVKEPPSKSMQTHGRGRQRCVRGVANVLRYSRPAGKDRLHNTAKPVPLLEELIRNSSDEDGVVVDFFLGSGSTLIAAERTGRRCYGLEADPKWVDVAVRRWEAETGRQAHRIVLD